LDVDADRIMVEATHSALILHTKWAMYSSMKGPFSSLHARALCHATEVLDRVKQAVLNTVGEVELETKRTAGYHGNEIVVVAAHSTDVRTMRHLFESLPRSDRELLLDTLEQRLDDSCNLFMRVDKQSAYDGKISLARSEDVIAVRMKVNAYPAKKAIAAQKAAEFICGLDQGE
jgi:RNA binding exosome subunit